MVAEWAQLQELFALGRPVVVWGPGCHRIGYDDPDDPGWATVTGHARQLLSVANPHETDFLIRYWRSKLSDETVRLDRIDDHRIDQQTNPDMPDVDRLRTMLAKEILTAYYESSRSLGALVASGVVPVIDWYEVPGRAHRDDPAVTAEQAEHLAKARHAVERALGLADAMGALCDKRALSRDQTRQLEALGVDPAVAKSTDSTDVRQLLSQLDAMKVGDIAGMLGTLTRTCFADDPVVPLTGALVEWLGDLLWHVLAIGARVPPSQAQLAFYVNLDRDADVTRHGFFSRARPGDYRRLEDEDQGKIVKDVERVLTHCYPTPSTQHSTRPARERFARTIAASLIEQWNQTRRDATGSNGLAGTHLTIALVADYDTLLEDALHDLLADDGAAADDSAYHVIVPVRARLDTGHGSRDIGIDWLFGTVKPKPVATNSRSRRPWKAERTWSWLRAVEYAGSGPEDRTVVGPIVIKLNGAPHHFETNGQDLRGPIAQLPIRRSSSRSDDHGAPSDESRISIEPLVAFAERSTLDTVTDLAAFGRTDNAGLASELLTAAGLSWFDRSWIFFGHDFADWLPRLRLYLSAARVRPYGAADARRRGGRKLGPSATVREHLAIDRSFGFPELALLESLGVRRIEEDLAEIANYPEKTTPATPVADVSEFLLNVRGRLDRGPE